MNQSPSNEKGRKKAGALIFIMALLPVFTLLYSGKKADRQEENAAAPSFQKKNFVAGKDTLRYQFYAPKTQDSTARYPLILFLHGAGERGTDNEAQLFHAKKFFGSKEYQQQHPCFVIAPQCPPKKRWAETDWTLASDKQPPLISTPLSLTLAAMKEICRTFPIDTCRLYITGLSMGGFGTWDAITRYPALFAAAVPVCGGGDETKAPVIRSLPVWAFHGDQDKAVMVQRSRNMIEAIKKAGGNPRYTEYKGVGHACWDQAYGTAEMTTWMFSQSKCKE